MYLRGKHELQEDYMLLQKADQKWRHAKDEKFLKRNGHPLTEIVAEEEPEEALKFLPTSSEAEVLQKYLASEHLDESES